MKITKQEYFNNLDSLPLYSHLIDTHNNCNYYILNGFRYEMKTITGTILKESFYKYKLIKYYNK